MTVGERITEHLARAPIFESDQDKLAARYFFSWLRHIEHAAVIFAERGLGSPGQLEDELVHRGLFEEIANREGGLLPVDPASARLLDFLTDASDEEAPFLFGLVGETYVETIFKYLANTWPLFAALADEESKHADFALRQEQRVSEASLRNVEELIADVATGPRFLIPLTHFLGVREAALLGLQNVRGHQFICSTLGLAPGSDIESMREKCNTAIRADAKGLPAKVHMDAWQESKARVFRSHPWMQDSCNVLVSTTSPAEIEAQIVQKVARILSRHPEMNRTYRAGQVWQPANIVVGVRRPYDKDGGRILTCYVDNPHLLTTEQIRKEVAAKLAKQRDRRYRGVAEYRGMETLLPPSRCSVAVTQTGQFGVHEGLAANAEDEALSINLCIGKAELKPWVSHADSGPCIEPKLACFLGYWVDHRVMDGREIGALTEELQREFSE